ncbi:hypothetical protein [Frigoriglobus tundricola]|uniref:Uncharacterized protein n=1 Tax=Frigoriglobus tundricola TaxID=2774151 RepID=A0A6M5YXE8_9BACT|nr:hypothetical protein [Frigoriglobus tundricola]QJW97883.1 hypothetical protein FTUN_5463 [Frigoriglobus tundricola]
MWLSKWKWALACCGALALTAGGALAVAARVAPRAPTPMVEPALLSAGHKLERPRRSPEPKKPPPETAWDIATEYLSLVIDDKPDRALKLGDTLTERHVKELQASGLKRVKLATIVINDSRVLVVTERANLKRRPDAEPADGYVTVTLERADAAGAWRVRESGVADEAEAFELIGDYLDGKFNRESGGAEVDEYRKPEQARGSRPVWAVAEEFLRLALAEKNADARKLTVPEAVPENALGQIRKGSLPPERGRVRKVESCDTMPHPVAILITDTQIEVAFRRTLFFDDGLSGSTGYLFVTLTKKGAGPWQVKAVDSRFEGLDIGARLVQCLGARIDAKPEK